MARIYMEGYEAGVPYGVYMPGGLTYIHEPDANIQGDTGIDRYLTSGRNAYSTYALRLNEASSDPFTNLYFQKSITSKSEIYMRFYVNTNHYQASVYHYWFGLAVGANWGIILASKAIDKVTLYVRYGGALTEIGTYDLQFETWKKIDLYFKINASAGAYEFKIDNVSQVSATGLDTGTTNIDKFRFGGGYGSGKRILYDDVAINDTSGTINNSWCGDGTIIGLKPKANGSTTSWDAEGYAIAENGTTTTNIEITGHGLSTNDVIYNATRNEYRIVTVVDANNLTVSSVTSQAENDIIVSFTYQQTIAATAGSTTYVTIPNHNLDAYDVIVNTSRSNAIRRVLYVSGSTIYNSNSSLVDNPGATVTSQTTGDSIKTFKVKFYTLSSNYLACANTRPNPQYSRIKTNVDAESNLFDMEELAADKLIASTSQINAAALSIYASDIGTGGSQIAPLLKSGASTNEGSNIALPVVSRVYHVVYDQSPFTTSRWTRAEIDGLEAGVKLNV